MARMRSTERRLWGRHERGLLCPKCAVQAAAEERRFRKVTLLQQRCKVSALSLPSAVLKLYMRPKQK